MPDTAEVHGFLTEAITNLQAATKRLESWDVAHGDKGLTYHRAVAALDAAHLARWHLDMAMKGEP